jgi:hypothetical protein
MIENTMPDQTTNQIQELKNEIAGWPKDQKASFMRGILDGLSIAVMCAEEVGCDIKENENFREFVDFLIPNAPPVKTRNPAAQHPKSERDQLFKDIKELLRRAIAGRLRIPKNTYDESLDAEEFVNNCLLTVIAIGNRDALDDTIMDLQIMRSITGEGTVDREAVKTEVESCHEKFRTEWGAITNFNELASKGIFKPKDIWAYLRSNVPVNYGYDDDELREIHTRYDA